MTETSKMQPTPGTDISLRGEEHVRVYRETNGETGYLWNGTTILLLTTKGRKSGEPRSIAIIYRQVGDKQVIIASKGGSPVHPAWYLNLLDEPLVEVQIKDEVFKARARTADSPEREELWAKAVEQWPAFDTYQSRTDRLIPVVVLERIEG